MAAFPVVAEEFALQLQWLDIKEGDHVLDVGCGIGLQAKAMAKLVGSEGKVAGTDLSNTLIEIARERTASSNLPLEFFTANALAQPFPDQSFDRIRTERVLMYIKDTQAVLREFKRLLKPGGKVVIFDFDWDGMVIPHSNKTLRKKNFQKTQMHNPKVSNVTNRLTITLFIVYLIALYWILLLKLGVQFSYMENRSVNLVPFKESLVAHAKIDVSEIILNVVIFVPLGIYGGILFKRWNFGKKLFIFFLVSLTVEALQFILAVGAFDITDIITNTSGGIIGLLIFKVIEKVFNSSVKAQKFINLIAATGTVLIIVLLLLLKLNMLPIKYQ